MPAAPSLTHAAEGSPHSGANGSSRERQLANHIRQQIILGAFRPGEQLSEQQLCLSLNTSRNTLRSVFRTLTEERLLTHTYNRGVFVARPTAADIIEIFRARRFIEGGSVRLARAEHPAMVSIADALAEAQQSAAAGDWLAVGTANSAFHAGIVQLSDSERIMTLFAQMSAQLRLAFRAVAQQQHLHSPYLSRNEQLFALMRSGELDAAGELLQRYLDDSERALLRELTAES